MNTFSKALVEARVADLHREAQKARARTTARDAARDAAPAPPRAVTLRVGTPFNMPAVEPPRLSPSDIPSAPVPLAEVDSKPRAALSDSGVIADPLTPRHRSYS
jgi:hypothetical protein